MKKSIWVILGLGIVLSGAIALTSNRADPGDVGRLRELEQQLRAATEQATQATHDAERVTRRMDVIAASDEQRASAPRVAVEASPAARVVDEQPSADPVEGEAHTGEDTLTTQLAEAFETATDTDWTRRGAQELKKLVQASLPDGSAARTQGCRGTLCRLDVTSRDGQSQRAFVDALFASNNWNGPMAIKYLDRDGSPNDAVIYLGEQGSELAEGSAWR